MFCVGMASGISIFLASAQLWRKVSEGFVKCFLRVPRLLGCSAAAMLPKQARGTFRKHITKPSGQVAAPPSIIIIIIIIIIIVM